MKSRMNTRPRSYAGAPSDFGITTTNDRANFYTTAIRPQARHNLTVTNPTRKIYAVGAPDDEQKKPENPPEFRTHILMPEYDRYSKWMKNFYEQSLQKPNEHACCRCDDIDGPTELVSIYDSPDKPKAPMRVCAKAVVGDLLFWARQNIDGSIIFLRELRWNPEIGENEIGENVDKSALFKTLAVYTQRFGPPQLSMDGGVPHRVFVYETIRSYLTQEFKSELECVLDGDVDFNKPRKIDFAALQCDNNETPPCHDAVGFKLSDSEVWFDLALDITDTPNKILPYPTFFCADLSDYNLVTLLGGKTMSFGQILDLTVRIFEDFGTYSRSNNCQGFVYEFFQEISHGVVSVMPRLKDESSPTEQQTMSMRTLKSKSQKPESKQLFVRKRPSLANRSVGFIYYY